MLKESKSVTFPILAGGCHPPKCRTIKVRKSGRNVPCQLLRLAFSHAWEGFKKHPRYPNFGCALLVLYVNKCKNVKYSLIPLLFSTHHLFLPAMCECQPGAMLAHLTDILHTTNTFLACRTFQGAQKKSPKSSSPASSLAIPTAAAAETPPRFWCRISGSQRPRGTPAP